VLSGCFAINEVARDLVDVVQQKECDAISSNLNQIGKYVRDLQRIAHVRSIALSVPDGNFLRVLGSKYPNLYEVIRTFAAFCYHTRSRKRGLFRRKNYYNEVCGRAIYTVKVLEGKHGLVIGLKEFYSEFVKLNPDIDISLEDIEKAVEILVTKGFIGGVEASEDGVKNIVLKYDYKVFLDSVRSFMSTDAQGFTLEQLITITDQPKFYVVRLLDLMEKDGIARKAIEPDGTVIWYFPGLKRVQKENIR
jgi:hypothetical protein